MKTLFPYRKFFTIIKEEQEQKEVMQIKTIDTPKKEALPPIEGLGEKENAFLAKTPSAHKFVTQMKSYKKDLMGAKVPAGPYFLFGLKNSSTYGDGNHMLFNFDNTGGLFSRKEGSIELSIKEGSDIFKITSRFSKYNRFQKVFKVDEKDFDKLTNDQLTQRCKPILDKIYEELQKVGIESNNFKIEKIENTLLKKIGVDYEIGTPTYTFQCAAVNLNSTKFKKMIDIIDNY